MYPFILLSIFQSVRKNGVVKYLEIPLESEINHIISFYHDTTHPGINATIDGIRNKYDWIGIHEDVRQYVRNSHSMN